MKILRALAAYAPAAPRDIAGVAGAALLCYGAWLAYKPLGFIIAGALLLAAAWRLSRSAE